ncbi:MAG: hypothetical protein PHW73_01165 [Atribacterota bacterium]|nr:hypothetical protein [Atribacterota bacterium]
MRYSQRKPCPSVAFTWDLMRAEKLYKAWNCVAPTKIGGPAIGAGENFEPGIYLKSGYVITSRGCNNNCWFCSVPKREGSIRELPITQGWKVTDDNLLACTESHIQKVFNMLKSQPSKPEITGGLEAKLLTLKRAHELKELNPKTIFFAYDTPDDLQPLIQAGEYLRQAGFRKKDHNIRAYILVGYPQDTFGNALVRIKQTWEAGFFLMAMLYRNDKGEFKREWKRFQREWANPTITAYMLNTLK